MHGVELAGPGTGAAPLLHPLAGLVVLGDTRVDVAVADVDVAFRIPGDVGGLTEAAVDRRQRRLGVLERMGVGVGGFRLAAEHHRDLAVLVVELDDHVRALVGGPDVVVLVDPHRMRERPGVEVLADLADELAVRREFEELRGGVAVGGAQAAAAARIDEHMAFRVHRDARRFTEIHVGRQLQEIRHGIERDLRHAFLCPGGKSERRNHRHAKSQQPTTHHCPPPWFSTTLGHLRHRILAASYLLARCFDSLIQARCRPP